MKWESKGKNKNGQQRKEPRKDHKNEINKYSLNFAIKSLSGLSTPLRVSLKLKQSQISFFFCFGL